MSSGLPYSPSTHIHTAIAGAVLVAFAAFAVRNSGVEIANTLSGKVNRKETGRIYPLKTKCYKCVKPAISKWADA